ncbi:MAG: aminotransferase class V-fold PLP-dependent enzyme [Solirubrobacterales bacterium]|jgi:selenocysteine lyase/cysteine desulfurase|nr:aminotransferase class V-fold PLP-dependent enzyme [Solirubrobacterales bacterium]
MDAAALRAQYPVFESVAYLNAGTCGPLPAAALRAAADSGLAAAEQGRGKAYFERMYEVRDALRAAYAGVVGGRPEDVALTTATSDGMAAVLSGLGLRRGDEVLTADDEHPGLYGPLAAAREQLGVDVRAVPLADIPDAVSPRTRLVACSHVSWISGALAPTALAELSEDVPVLLDGAQGAGAVPVDVAALGCAFYAAAGQKWLCGPVGTGLLWVAPRWRERLSVRTPTYLNLSVPSDGLRALAWQDARALDAPALSNEAMLAALAAHDVLAEQGWPEVHDRATGLAARLAERLRATGRAVAPRDATTLVAWEQPDPDAAAARLAAAGITVRPLPGTPFLRASVGAWNDESDLDRLLRAL